MRGGLGAAPQSGARGQRTPSDRGGRAGARGFGGSAPIGGEGAAPPQGFFAYTVDKKDAVPHVVPFGAGEFRTRAQPPHWHTEMALFCLQEGRRAETPQRDVFFAWETPPDLDGVPSSAVCTYARMRYFKVGGLPRGLPPPWPPAGAGAPWLPHMKG